MPRLDQIIPRIFRHAWTRYGKPTMLVVRPMSGWSLPAGFAYDKDVDAIRNSSGTVLTNAQDYWATDYVYIVPSASQRGSGDIAELQELLVHGTTTLGSLAVWVLQDDIAKLRAAHAILLGDQWYDLDHQQQQPSGYPDTAGLWAHVRLKARS